MDERIKGMWVDALLSGEYPKTEGYLHDENGYCGYGVLCDLAAKEGVEIAVQAVPESLGDRAHWTYNGQFNQPPEAVQEWAGFEDQVRDRNRALWQVNDETSGNSFDDVARFLKDL